MESEEKELLGSVIEIKLPKEHSSFFSLAFSEIERIENTYSRFIDSSELSKVNAKLNTWHSVSKEFVDLLKTANDIHKKTDGNFDIALKHDLDELGYNKDHTFKPVKRHIDLSPQNIEIKGNKIRSDKEIDLGGLGKGYALDQVANILRKVPQYYINAGGDILAKEGDSPFAILLEHPDDPELAIGKIRLKDRAIASSAPNRRKWKGAHHLLNAKSKLPQDDTKAIFVLAKKGIEADAYATALFTAGFDEAMKLAKKIPVTALIISKDNKVFKSDDFDVEFFS